MNPNFFLSNIYGHNARAQPFKKYEEKEVKKIVQDVLYNTNQNTLETQSYYPQQQSYQDKSVVPTYYNVPSRPTPLQQKQTTPKQKVTISEDMFLAIRQIVRNELEEFEKKQSQKQNNDTSSENKELNLIRKLQQMHKEIQHQRKEIENLKRFL